ncbi:hypothetical protein CPC08DRAFT_158755 [Agrocybe pediades]|nr:hypothetical protein CPC08DRAFT_158755 [Agrocybe pediades]
MDSSTTSTMVITDPVSSLRAAALSTLKSKRRKQVPKPSAVIPVRPPPPTDNFQLDYGQDDVPMADAETTISAPTVSNDKEASRDDVQMREEGEISEEEEVPRVVKQPLSLMERLSDSPMTIVRKSTTPETRITMKQEPPSSPRGFVSPEVHNAEVPRLALADRISDAPSHVLDMYDGDAPLESYEESYDPLHSISSLGPNCVRPGLELNQEQYDNIKELILDLLGWNVPPEDLLQYGIRKEVLYYVFNELELRLPESFDPSGIIPYTPESFNSLPESALIPPPAVQAPINSTSPAQDELMTQLTTPRTSNLSPSSVSPVVTDLHDMERQRRQELMARKAAVQASRRQKQSAAKNAGATSPNSSNVSQPNGKIDVGSVVPDVDDFLNSISPVQGRDIAMVIPPLSQPIVDARDMDNDAVPSKAGPVEVQPTQTGASSDIQQPLSTVTAVQMETFNDVPPSSVEPPPTSVESSVSTFSFFSESSESGSSGTVTSVSQRRSTKRPVASDFVDLEPVTKIREPTNREYVNPKPTGITRRITSGSGFQGLASRRCVIDLSDSEDDDREVQSLIEEQPIHSWRSNPSSDATIPAPPKPSFPAFTPPAALAEKEAEIRKMREMIAKREEERLRKLALSRSTSAVTNNQSAAAKPSLPEAREGATRPKAEDHGVDMNGGNESTSSSIRVSDSITPPPSIHSVIESASGSTTLVDGEKGSKPVPMNHGEFA